ncbi:MAG: hypothetical protein ACJ0DD_03790 [Paracoccaceae bacterium]
MIRIIIAFFFIILVVTFTIWLSFAKIQENYIKDLISNNLEKKYKVTYSLKTTGFPNRLDTTLKDIKLISKTNSELIVIKSFLFMSLIYNKKNYIFSIEPPINIKIDSNLFVVNEGKISASMANFKDNFLSRFTFHGVNLNLNLNNKPFFKIDDLIFATRSKYSSIKAEKNEFFLKLQRPMLHNLNRDKNKNFNFKFSLDHFKNVKLPPQLIKSEFFKKNFIFSNGNIEINETNIDIKKHISEIPKYFEHLLVNKNPVNF